MKLIYLLSIVIYAISTSTNILCIFISDNVKTIGLKTVFQNKDRL